MKHLYQCSSIAFLVLAVTLFSPSITEAQILVTSPMSSVPEAGDYYSPTGITLSPGFSFTAATGQSLRLYISNCVQLNTLPSGNQNYILTTTPRVGGIRTNTGFSNRSNCELMQTVEYFDGLGRPMQTIKVKASSTSKDIVQPFVYDQFGRKAVEYLSYSSSDGSAGSFRVDALNVGAGLRAFYNPGGNGVSGDQQSNGIAIIPNPYSASFFESSPLERIIEQGAAGDSWQLTGTANYSGLPAGHTNKVVFATNSAATVAIGQYYAKHYAGTQMIGYDGTTYTYQPAILTDEGFYNIGDLSVTVTKNENWQEGQIFSQLNTAEEYKNKLDQIVLKRTFNLNTINNSLEVLSTYYVYDNSGALTFVLPPSSNPDVGITSNNDQSKINRYCYQYVYDALQRIIQKRLPGKDWEFIVYNKANQPVLTQDGLQRISNQWTVTKYDGLGRIILTGLWNAGNVFSQSTIQSNFYSGPQWDARDNTNNTISNPTGYILSSFPVVSKVLAVYYYDDYLNIPGFAGYAPTAGTYTNMTKGLLTASKIAVLNTIGNSNPDYLWSANYYDKEGRVTRKYQQHYKGGTISVNNYDETAETYSFTDELLTSSRFHYVNNLSNAKQLALTVNMTYDYDHVGRKTNTWEQINGGTNVLLAQNTYNEVGQVMTKKLHSADAGNNFLQSIDYAYNERGWLTRINDPNNPPTTAKLFSEQLKYNNTLDPAAAQFNGNIAEQAYRVYNSSPTGIQTVKYTYDKLNRLTDGTNSTGLSETGITYDGVGNILALTRATAPNAASLVYQYTGNQLTTVTKGGAAFRSYGYDANGNATSDGQSNTITYNLLNLPQSIPGKSLTYTYDATGRKLRKVSGSTVTEYINGIQYNGNTIDFIQTEEGRATNSAGTYKYEYTLTDHLGNNRVSFDETSGKVQEMDYYPFGLNVNRQTYFANKYLYNKKELQEELTQYDYGARFYDPVIARWGHVDPKAELYFNLTPYSYAANNPINAIDPNGHLVIFINGLHRGEGGSPKYWNGFDRAVQRHFNDFNKSYGDNYVSGSLVDVHMNGAINGALYIDGALGGLSNTLNHWGTTPNNLDVDDRLVAGYTHAGIDVSDIINSLQRTNGVITESIKVVSHSMGAAYARGLIFAIVEYARKHPQECTGLSITEYDFAAFQQNSLPAPEPGVTLYQYDNVGDAVVGGVFGSANHSRHTPEKGREQNGSNDNVNPKGGHSITDFISEASQLPAGKYRYENGKIVRIKQ